MNDIIDVVTESEEFENNVVERGPTRKQLKQMEKLYSKIMDENDTDNESEVADVSLSKEDLAGIRRIQKYIDNAKLAKRMTDGEYVAVKRKDDDEVRELDCDFRMESMKGGMFED